MDIDRSLARYLSNKAKWNESCRMWFEEGGGEFGAVSEESDLESEEDDLESEEGDLEDE